MDSFPGNLSGLQRDFLETWFRHTQDYFLTGGALLAGFTGLPRITKDLDLFTVSPEAFERAKESLRAVVYELGAEISVLRESPEFLRYRIKRGDESTLLDLVLDRAPQIFEPKQACRGLLVDRLEEVLVNKVCALVGRGEARDFVDTWYLCDPLGLDRSKALEQAQSKDRGVDAGALLFVLRDVDWEQFRVPGVEPEVVRQTVNFFRAWSEELALRLFPGH